MLHTSVAGRRIEMATQPAVVAGGSTICTRSPLGRDADRSGEAASTRCWVEFATSFAKPAAPFEIGKRQGLAAPPAARLHESFVRPVDAEFHDIGVGEQRPQRSQRQFQRGLVVRPISGPA